MSTKKRKLYLELRERNEKALAESRRERVQRRFKRQPAHSRCARCKQLRKMFMRANEWGPGRVSSMNVMGEGKVCWVCRIREIDPTWRPGKPMPAEVPNATKFSAAAAGDVL